jgi:hypothetical protein
MLLTSQAPFGIMPKAQSNRSTMELISGFNRTILTNRERIDLAQCLTCFFTIKRENSGSENDELTKTKPYEGNIVAINNIFLILAF